MSFAEWVDVFRDIFISLFFLSGVVLMVARQVGAQGSLAANTLLYYEVRIVA